MTTCLYGMAHKADRRYLDKRTPRDRRAGKQSRGICFAANAPVYLYGEFTMMEIYTVSFFGHKQLDDFMGPSAGWKS